MKKQLHLLIENLFDDLYDIDQETNQDIDLADQIYQYELGDIYYKDKVPYAICCGEKTQFTDNNDRFALLKQINEAFSWFEDYYTTTKDNSFNNNYVHKYNAEYIKELKSYSKKNIKFRNDVYSLKSFGMVKIDENGYENTKIFKSKCNGKYSFFQAFNSCVNLGDNVYLPAIDELSICSLNLDSEKLNELKKIILSSKYSIWFWSSTQANEKTAWNISMEFQYIDVDNKQNSYSVIPFVKI